MTTYGAASIGQRWNSSDLRIYYAAFFQRVLENLATILRATISHKQRIDSISRKQQHFQSSYWREDVFRLFDRMRQCVFSSRAAIECICNEVDYTRKQMSTKNATPTPMFVVHRRARFCAPFQPMHDLNPGFALPLIRLACALIELKIVHGV